MLKLFLTFSALKRVALSAITAVITNTDFLLALKGEACQNTFSRIMLVGSSFLTMYTPGNVVSLVPNTKRNMLFPSLSTVVIGKEGFTSTLVFEVISL